ncbi:DUF6352 family protein [Bradyrhizobium sp. Arg237L]|uniref:DUF6352 family protein n=1 Tax=Bradyrhizobium sp. Arg237L TaxID=3003352 RepID=UPI00249F84DD|nr:DUF6352 family protein [Bradyrhizobium sp. Arg237L]MDI4239501.1 DUF6352 family protein [Bradyrhizobium sp. Arg237L]
MRAPRDFWLACGHHLLDRDENGRLLVTDDFLKVYLARPELMPPPEACAAEQELHRALLRHPRRPVAARQIEAIADGDARENWRTMIAWRDHLVKHGCLEAAYLAIVRRNIAFPQVLVGQLVQVILRNALDDCRDAFMLRAAEMFFRPQKLMIEGASVLAVDEERGSVTGRHSASPLMALLGLPDATEVDVLNESTAGGYWERSDRFDMALDLAAGGRGLAALGDVIGRWLLHLLAIEVEVEPVAELREASWNWYVGLSSDATRIGDAIWHGDDLDDGSRAQLVGLFRLTFRDPSCMIEKVRGEPVHLLLAMTADEVLRLKPQNLITGLPIANAEAVN